jgi:hypothetical protein
LGLGKISLQVHEKESLENQIAKTKGHRLLHCTQSVKTYLLLHNDEFVVIDQLALEVVRDGQLHLRRALPRNLGSGYP